MSHQINLTRIKGVANALKNCSKEIVFVGGATVSLYADEPEQVEIRPTDDIDILIEVATYADYTKLQKEIQNLGFEIDVEAKVTCRYKYQGLIIDIMPTEGEVLGFSNRWYKEGFANLETYKIDEGTDINIFPVSYFIASKIEAFHHRGNSDGRMSKDFEDIVSVLDNRASVWDDFLLYEGAVLEYIKKAFSELLQIRYFEEWLSVHLEVATAGTRSRMIIKNMKKFVNNA
jgi:predicted nucleotidyltransferase